MNPTNPQFPFCPPFVIPSAPPFVILSAAEGSHRPQSPISPHRPQKNSLLLRVTHSVLLCVFLFFYSCTDTAPQPAKILVTVSNECVCNVFLYSPDGLCLQSKIWDCQETKVLSFTTFYEGILTVKAEYKSKSASVEITALPGITTEASIIL